MRIPKIHGVIRRRILVNFRVDPRVIQRHLPQPFRPKLHDGSAVAGICLIRLEQIRPRPVPALLGLSSENAAHRIAVVWSDDAGSHEGVYIPRRDTGSTLSHLVGGKLFPGEHHRARFQVNETPSRVELHMRSFDEKVAVDVAGNIATDLPKSSRFRSIAEASAYFEGGSVGYSATAEATRLDGVTLKTRSWAVEPLAVEYASSSFFSDSALFPEGSVHFDCALIMRNIQHEWQAAEDMYIEPVAI